jgi:tetratricopeptide (TPR) repeat protein
MKAIMGKLALVAVFSFLLAGLSWGQVSAIEGDVIAEDGSKLQGALIRIERTDIKGSYKVKTDKKGHYFHTGLPLGTYTVILEVNGKVVDQVKGVRTRLGDPVPVNFDLHAKAQKRAAMQKAAEVGKLTKEQTREMTPEERAELERQMKERAAALARNKELNEAFNQGMEGLKTRQWQQAIDGFQKAVGIDPKQHVIWGNLAEAYMGLSATKTGAEQQEAWNKAIEAYNKAIELKPDDAAYHNNFALALAKQKKFDEARAELEKAAQINPAGAGQYYYNLGAVLTNIGQIEAATEAFKRAVDADPKYANAQYQYGVSLMGKATVGPDGKMIAPPGAREAFEKYLQLEPNGPNAEAAKAMLEAMSQTVQTEFKNPSAPPPSKKTTGKKK